MIEYRRVTYSLIDLGLMDESLYNAGLEEWELCGVLPQTREIHFYFKRNR